MSQRIEWETIAAIATPRGEGGLGIVRVSGNRAIPIACQIFRSPSGISPSDMPSHTLNYGHVIEPGSNRVVDEALLGIMRAPRSYTVEDVVELNCHGGMTVLRRVLELTLSAGARLAEPGEFTKRAFLNGRLDLAQAEAVVSLIRSKTDLTVRVAVDQLMGKLSSAVNALNDRLANLLAEVEASIDFPDEALDFIEQSELQGTAQAVLKALDELLATAKDGRILQEGINVAILGRPNVGKSSLLNTLLQEDRAIVTEIPGTTRDTLDAPLNLSGIPLNLIDTAGLRHTDDVVEQHGVRRARAAAEKADLLLILLDASQPLTAQDEELLELAKSRKSLVVLNKTDLPVVLSVDAIRARTPNRPIVQTSLLLGHGLAELKAAIIDETLEGGSVFDDTSPIITNVRHQDALSRAKLALEQALESIGLAMPPELIAVDIRRSLDCLGEIVGRTTTEDILGRIFSQFCIGK